MNTSELLANLHRQGFTLTPLPGGKLEVKPASKLTDELRQELRQRKNELLTLLVHRPKPYLNERGELIIPFDSDHKYHWWAGGQSLRETLRELGAPPEVVGRYIDVDLTIKQ